MNLKERAFAYVPNNLKPLAKRGYKLLHPSRSLLRYEREQGKLDAISEYHFSGLIDRTELGNDDCDFVERFFEDREEYESYVNGLRKPEILDHLEASEDEVPERWNIYDIHLVPCQRYYAYIRKYQPEIIVESGVHNGISTFAALAALKHNQKGKLYSVSDPSERNYSQSITNTSGKKINDISNPGDMARIRPSASEPGSYAVPEGKSPGWIVPDEYKERWELHTGRPRSVLPEIKSEVDDIGLFMHDSKHSASEMLFEFSLAWEWLTHGGALVSHHVEWNEAFATFVKEHNCDYGLVSFHMSDEEARYNKPGSTGYIRKPIKGARQNAPKAKVPNE